MIPPERQLEEALVAKLRDLKYEHRRDIRDRAALEANFRKKFEALNRVTLTDGEFQRFLDEIVTPDAYAAAKWLRDEFNRFQENCVEENTNTAALVRRLESDDYADKVIVTTIQKLGLALDENSKHNKQNIVQGRSTFKQRLKQIRDKRLVFIFDECHGALRQ
jgi:type I site-specific restriction-modification system R (restriction) subunit